ncbi:MAG: long-chain fatty acid--CoA ligase [Vicinamibacterales bacterium]
MHRPWLAHYDYWVPPHLTYPEQPLWEILDTTCVEMPNAPATAFLGATLTYRQIKTQSDWLAASLGTLGVSKGDRVGIMLPNCPQYVIAAFAVLRCGAIVVNVNPSLTQREVQHIAQDSGMRTVLTLGVLASLVLAVQTQTSIEDVIVTALDEYSTTAAPPLPVPGTRALADMVTGQGRPPVTRVPTSADDVAVLQYTGGTTGSPKGAMLTHRNIFANVIQTETFTYRSRTRGEGRYMMVLPYSHVFGFTVGLMKGTWVGALQILIPKFDVVGVLTAVREFVPTYFPAVPTVWVALLAHSRAAEFGLDRVRVFTSGGAPCPPEVLDRFERTFGRSLFEGFGMSEASPVTHSTPLFGVRKQGTVGLPMPDTDIDVVDTETGEHSLATGEAGELCICGPQVMKGYWNKPDETAHALRTHADGRVWLHTGDIATIDADGYTRIVQRKKDMLIVNGFNVYPSEVEGILCQHPDVATAAVIGVPDAYHGEVVRAFVVLKQDRTTALADLSAHCARELAPYKVPRQIEIRSALPMTGLGKVLYRVLREETAARAAASK